jgi:hypothetical protein
MCRAKVCDSQSRTPEKDLDMRKARRLVVSLVLATILILMLMPLSAGAQEEAEVEYMYSAINGLRVRAEPSLKAEVLTLLKCGEQVTVLDAAPIVEVSTGIRWTHIEVERGADVIEGYSATYYLRETKPNCTVVYRKPCPPRPPCHGRHCHRPPPGGGPGGPGGNDGPGGGPGGTPPGQGGTPPGQGGTPPGQGGGGGQGGGPGGTPPGQGGTPPGQGGTPPGQGGDGGQGGGPGGTPPGQGGTPPGQGGTPPGQGD